MLLWRFEISSCLTPALSELSINIDACHLLDFIMDEVRVLTIETIVALPSVIVPPQ